MRRRKKKLNQYWWIETGVPDNEKESGCIRYSLTKLRYSEVKKGVWRIFRLNLDREDLSSSDKIVLYCLCERFRVQSMSSTDALNYLAKMSGIGRKTVGKSVQKLADKEVIWIVEEGAERRRHRGLEARRFFKKHFLIVGLSYELSEG